MQKETVILTEKDINGMIISMMARLSSIMEKRGLKSKSVKILGIPRGGIAVAYRIAGLLDAEITADPGSANLIVDDIVATGKTRDKFITLSKTNRKVTDGEVIFDSLIPSPEAGKWYVFPWEETEIGSSEDIPTRLLEYIGEDPTRDGLKDTPARYIKAWSEITRGYKQDPKEFFKAQFLEKSYNQMVILKDIEFFSVCEHHLLPFYGKVHIGYIPQGKVLGISKLARVVDCFSRRLQIQERLTQQIADIIQEMLCPVGVAVYIEARHLCMMMRGVEKKNSLMLTSALKGALDREGSARMEFLLLSK